MATLDHETVAALVSGVRQLTGTLLAQANALVNLDQISKSGRMRPLITTQIGETLSMMQDQGGKLLSAAKNSKNCFTNLQSLQMTLQDTQRFFSELRDVTAVFLVKKKMKQKCTDLANAIMAKRTQLFSSVTMALVSGPMSNRSIGARLPPGVKVVSTAGGASGASASGSSDVDVRSSRNTLVSSAASSSSPSSSDATSPTGLGATATRFDFAGNDASNNPRGAQRVSRFEDDERVALHGHADHMMYSSGYAYYYGIGRPRNLSLALGRFQEAAEVGDSDAMMMLVKCYGLGHGVDRNIKEAQEWLLQAVKAGSPSAKTHLASLLLVDNPHGAETANFLRDYMLSTAAGADLKESSRGSNSSSQSDKKWKGLHRKSLGHMQIHAFTGDRSEESDASVSVSHAGDGDVSVTTSSYALADHERDVYCKEGVTLLLEAAADGDLDAQCNLGLVNQEAGNLEDAYKWYLASSNDGCPRATCLLGVLLLRGEGTPDKKKDEHKAYALFISAARGGELDGFYYAGLCCERGLLSEGFHKRTQPNLQLAIQFYESGASEGHLECTYSYGYLLLRQAVELLAERAPGEDRRHAIKYCLTPREAIWYENTASKGVHYLRIAADRGVSDARYQLGRAYMAGIGVPYDVHAAYECFQFACNTSHDSQDASAPGLTFARETSEGGNFLYDLHRAGADSSTTYSNASLEAGNILYSGFGSQFPTQVELNQAARMYAISARGGSTQAMNNLGLLLEEGRVSYEVQSSSVSSPVSEEKEEAPSLSCAGSPQPLLAARYYLCAATHNNADAMLNLAHLLVRGVIEEKDTKAVRFLPLPHGPLVNSLLALSHPPTASAGRSKAEKKPPHHKVSDTVSLRDIATWLVDNAITPSHSPALAQEFSSLLDALERMATSSGNGVDDNSLTLPPAAADKEDREAQSDRDRQDFLGILQLEHHEADQRARALQEQKRIEQEEGRKLVAEVMQAVKSLPPVAGEINESTLSSQPPKLRPSGDTPPVPGAVRPAAATMPLKTADSLSAEKSPTAGKFSSSTSGIRGGGAPPEEGSASADHTPQGGKFDSDPMLHVIPDSYSLPPPQISALGTSESAVNSGAADKKTRSLGASSMQAADGVATAKPVIEKNSSSTAAAVAGTRSSSSIKRGGAFALTSIATDLDDSLDSSEPHSQRASAGRENKLGATYGSLDISTTNTNSDIDVSVATYAASNDVTSGRAEKAQSEDVTTNRSSTYSHGGIGTAKTSGDIDGNDDDDLSFSHASLSKISAAVTHGLPPRPPSPAMVPPPLGKPTPSISPRNTGTASGSATTAATRATKSSSVNKAAAAALFEDVSNDDTEEDEFEFSLASRDSTAISTNASRDFDRTANSSLDVSASAGTSSNVSGGKNSKSKGGKKAKKAPPRNLQNLSSSFEFDSSFN